MRRSVMSLVVILASLNVMAWGIEFSSQFLVNQTAPQGTCSTRADRKSIDEIKESLQVAFSQSGPVEFHNPPGGGSGSACGCSGCTVTDTRTESYCENHGSSAECGSSWNWFDDDFKWEASYNIYTCPEGQYRACGAWSRAGCCTGGSHNPPPSTCDPLDGRAGCHTRDSSCPNARAIPAVP